MLLLYPFQKHKRRLLITQAQPGDGFDRLVIYCADGTAFERDCSNWNAVIELAEQESCYIVREGRIIVIYLIGGIDMTWGHA